MMLCLPLPVVFFRQPYKNNNIDSSAMSFTGVIKFRINPDFRIEHSGMMHMMPYLLLLKFGFHIFK